MKKQLTIRLFRFGRKHKPFFRIGVSSGYTHPSKGNALEFIGSYDPVSKAFKINEDRAKYYIALNIELSNSVKSIFKNNQIIK